MTTPLIGITTGRTISKTTTICAGEAYVKAVIRAGGLPVLLPVGIHSADFDEIYARLDGLLLTGGGDIDPALYHGRTHDEVYGVDGQRDDLEIGLVRLAAESGWPFLGICRGIQVINVALGGTLYTHIADQLPNPLHHAEYPGAARDFLAHPVQINPTSSLAKILETQTTAVNSLHHQGIEKVAQGLRAIAEAPDHLVEAVELPGHPFGLGVQWHPEWMPDSLAMQALFKSFIQAAAG
jgi:putative glutamine amidotransferase